MDADEAEEAEAPPATMRLEDLVAGEADPRAVPPTLQDVDDLVAEYHRRWVRPELSCAALSGFVYEALGLRVQAHVSWEDFQRRHRAEVYRMMRLHVMLGHYRVSSGDSRNRLNEVSYVLHSIPRFVIQAATLMNVVSPAERARNEVLLPADFREYGADRDGEETVVDHDKTKLNSFQNTFLYLREILQGCGYRRADGRFFARIVTASGYDALAFREEKTVEDFVREFTAHQFDFTAWKWITDKGTNLKDTIKYLRECVLPRGRRPGARTAATAPTRATPSAAARACTTRARVLLIPYARRGPPGELAERATAMRRAIRGEEAYRLEAPPDAVVCVVHLPGGVRRRAGDRRRARGRARPLLARGRRVEADSAAAARRLVDAPGLAAALARRIAPDEEEPEAALGRCRRPSAPRRRSAVLADGSWTCLDGDAAEAPLVAALREGCEGTSIPWALLGGVHSKCYVTLRDGTPSSRCARRAAAGAPSRGAEAQAHAGRRAAAARSSDPRRAAAVGAVFRVDVGRTWRDCAAEDIDRIYQCQKFTVRDAVHALRVPGAPVVRRGGARPLRVHLDARGHRRLRQVHRDEGDAALLAAAPARHPQLQHAAPVRDGRGLARRPRADHLLQRGERGAAGRAGGVADERQRRVGELRRQEPAGTAGAAVARAALLGGQPVPAQVQQPGGAGLAPAGGVLMTYPVQPRDGFIFDRIRRSKLERAAAQGHARLPRVRGHPRHDRPDVDAGAPAARVRGLLLAQHARDEPLRGLSRQRRVRRGRPRGGADAARGCASSTTTSSRTTTGARRRAGARTSTAGRLRSAPSPSCSSRSPSTASATPTPRSPSACAPRTPPARAGRPDARRRRGGRVGGAEGGCARAGGGARAGGTAGDERGEGGRRREGGARAPRI